MCRISDTWYERGCDLQVEKYCLNLCLSLSFMLGPQRWTWGVTGSLCFFSHGTTLDKSSLSVLHYYLTYLACWGLAAKPGFLILRDARIRLVLTSLDMRLGQLCAWYLPRHCLPSPQKKKKKHFLVYQPSSPELMMKLTRKLRFHIKFHSLGPRQLDFHSWDGSGHENERNLNRTLGTLPWPEAAL